MYGVIITLIHSNRRIRQLERRYKLSNNMSTYYSPLSSITVTQINSANTLKGTIVYNPDGDLFYALGNNTGSIPVAPNLSYILRDNNQSATCYPIGNPPNEVTRSNSANNLYSMVYYNGVLYINYSFGTYQAVGVHKLSNDYKSVVSSTSIPNFSGSLCQLTINPYSNSLYLFGSRNAGGGYFIYDPSYVRFDLINDPSLNNGTTYTNFDRTLNATQTNAYANSVTFDSNNNFYYVLIDGIYKAPIDSTFSIVFNNKIKIVSFTTNQITNTPFLTYNTYNNSLYYNYNNGSVSGVYMYDTSSYTIFNVTYRGIAISTSFDVYFLPNQASGSTFIMYANYRIICFKEDTQILTRTGYKLIQELKKGDLVKTYQSGYKPIYKIGYTEINHHCSEERIKSQMYKCSSENYPEIFEDLIITGCHCILVDEYKNEKEREDSKLINNTFEKEIYLTENMYRLPACVDERTTVYEVEGLHKIYHFALENDDYYMNYGVYANGLLVETTSKRFMDEDNLIENA